MRGFAQQFRISLLLHLRNRMGLIYGYLFPAVFLLAFWVLYRRESVPLVAHMGELLTISVLGGACFGLPTTLVSERERGVWRRYRLAPVSTGVLVASTVAARYVILLSAGVLQLVLALALGMPRPEHGPGLWVAYTLVSFAFLGLGLVIATLADNVPAVQALGQVIFLPMLIIGGIAVRLANLPAWAQHASAFFPGRYAVDALQACVDGAGLGAAGFSLLALALIGVAGFVAGARMFRWDAQQRFATLDDRGWLAFALAAWVAVGALAELRGHALAPPGVRAEVRPSRPAEHPAPPPAATPLPPARDTRPAPERPDSPTAVATSGPDTASRTTPTPATQADSAAPPAPREPPPGPPAGWRAVRVADIDPRIFQVLPPDEDVVTPVARLGERPPQRSTERALDCVRGALPEWPPARVADPVQRVRNQLYVAAVPDILQMEDVEPFLPLVVYDQLRRDFPREQLAQLLYWIVRHPAEGSIDAASQLDGVCIEVGGRTVDTGLLHERTGIYARKLLGRLLGRIPG